MNARFLIFLILFALFGSSAQAQLRRPGVLIIEREDREKSDLVKEEGAIYLQGMVDRKLVVRVTVAAPAYATLGADRWLGNLLPNQNAVLLAASETAYRVRAKAKQGQIAGWVSKAAIDGLPEAFEANLRLYHERHLIVSELIERKQVALGMTLAEVTAAIGPPDKRNSTVNQAGRTDSLEYISYERIPQTIMAYDAFGRPVPVTQYIEVESGRVQIGFHNELVTSISESEGIGLSNARFDVTVPPLVFLF